MISSENETHSPHTRVSTLLKEAVACLSSNKRILISMTYFCPQSVNNTSACKGCWNKFIADIFIWQFTRVAVMVWSVMVLRSSKLPETTARSENANWKLLNFWNYLSLKSSLRSRPTCISVISGHDVPIIQWFLD